MLGRTSFGNDHLACCPASTSTPGATSEETIMKCPLKYGRATLEGGLGLLLVGLSVPTLARAFTCMNWRVLINLFVFLIAFAYVRDRKRINGLAAELLRSRRDRPTANTTSEVRS